MLSIAPFTKVSPRCSPMAKRLGPTVVTLWTSTTCKPAAAVAGTCLDSWLDSAVGSGVGVGAALHAARISASTIKIVLDISLNLLRRGSSKFPISYPAEQHQTGDKADNHRHPRIFVPINDSGDAEANREQQIEQRHPIRRIAKLDEPLVQECAVGKVLRVALQ